MPLDQPLSPGNQISNFLANLYVNIYHIQKICGRSLEWLVLKVSNSPDKFWVVLGMPVVQPLSPTF